MTTKLLDLTKEELISIFRRSGKTNLLFELLKRELEEKYNIDLSELNKGE